MNLIINRECSNSCPYCFETAERRDGKQGLISMENVAEFAKWARTARLGYLSLLGGEPFLHPKLTEIIALLRQTCPGTSLRLLTGGVFKKELLDRLSPQDVALVFNINEPRDYRNPKHFNKVLNNVEIALRKGFKVTVGFNVWRLDFDTTFMPNLVNSFGLSSFTWTVANPIRDCPSNVVPPEQFSPLARQCFLMLQRAAFLNIECVLDCPLPLCFFNDAELAWIRQYHPETASGMGVCVPVLDVTPELEVLRCFALSKLPRLKLKEFRSDKEIEAWFLLHLDTTLLDSGCFSTCVSCIHFIKGRCYGGCLACHDSIVKDEQLSNVTTLEMRMDEAIKMGKPEIALNYFENANYWSKTDVAILTAAVAASEVGDWDKAFRYATDANARSHHPDFMKTIGEFILSIPASYHKEVPNTPQQAPQFISCTLEKSD